MSLGGMVSPDVSFGALQQAFWGRLAAWGYESLVERDGSDTEASDVEGGSMIASGARAAD